jgi:hypothetical protein
MGRSSSAESPEAVEASVEEREVIFLSASHGARLGERRTLPAEKAASLVKRRLARYPE